MEAEVKTDRVTFSKKEAIVTGWELFKKNFKFLFLVEAILISVDIIFSQLQRFTQDNLPFLSMILSIISTIVNLSLTIGVSRISFSLIDGKKPVLRELYDNFNITMWKYFLGSLLYGLIVVAGFILLIVPGIYWTIKYQFYGYLIIDRGMSPMDAIKKSGTITQGNKMNLFLLGLAYIGLVLVGLAALFIGLLVTYPIIMLASAWVYRKLSPKSS